MDEKHNEKIGRKKLERLAGWLAGWLAGAAYRQSLFPRRLRKQVAADCDSLSLSPSLPLSPCFLSQKSRIKVKIFEMFFIPKIFSKQKPWIFENPKRFLGSQDKNFRIFKSPEFLIPPKGYVYVSRKLQPSKPIVNQCCVRFEAPPRHHSCYYLVPAYPVSEPRNVESHRPTRPDPSQACSSPRPSPCERATLPV